jgi:hypothetical protein
MTTNTLGGFCRDLLYENLYGAHPNPEAMAARFVDYFDLPVRPSLDQLSDLMGRAGFGTVKDGEMEGLKGAHIGEPRGEYDIYHRNDLWEGTKRPTRCCTKPTRSSTRPCVTSIPAVRRSGPCAGRPTASRRRF